MSEKQHTKERWYILAVDRMRRIRRLESENAKLREALEKTRTGIARRRISRIDEPDRFEYVISELTVNDLKALSGEE